MRTPRETSPTGKHLCPVPEPSEGYYVGRNQEADVSLHLYVRSVCRVAELRELPDELGTGGGDHPAAVRIRSSDDPFSFLTCKRNLHRTCESFPFLKAPVHRSAYRSRTSLPLLPLSVYTGDLPTVAVAGLPVQFRLRNLGRAAIKSSWIAGSDSEPS